MLKYTSYLTTLSAEAEITIISTNGFCPSMETNGIMSKLSDLSKYDRYGTRMFQDCSFLNAYNSNGKQHCVFKCRCDAEALICNIYFWSVRVNLEFCEIEVTS